MKLYQTPNGTWAGTEKDWKAALKAEGVNLKSYTGRKIVEVPTDKSGLLEFLSFHNVNVIAPREPGKSTAQLPAPKPPAAPSAPLPMDATSTLSRMQNPGVNVDSIVETIGSSKGYALKRYAGAVAVAFQSLSGD